MVGFILLCLTAGRVDAVSLPLGAYTLREAIAGLYPAYGSDRIQLAPEIQSEAGIFGFKEKARREAVGAIERAFGVTVAETGGRVVVARDARVAARDREWISSLANILAAQVAEHRSAYVSGLDQLRSGANYEDVPANSYSSFMGVHGFAWSDEAINGLLSPFETGGEMRRTLEVGSDVQFLAAGESNFPAIKSACQFVNVDPSTFNSGAVGALLSVTPGQLTVRMAANLYPDDPSPYLPVTGSGGREIGAQLPLEPKRERHPKPANPLVTSLFRGEKNADFWLGHPSLGKSAEDYYQKSLDATDIAVESGALDDSISSLDKPTFDSLSQLVQAWASHDDRSVVMDLSPIQEQLAELRRSRDGHPVVLMKDLFRRASPWWIEEYGDHIFVLHNRLDFLDHQWRQPLAAILAAERAMPESINAKWRRILSGEPFVPAEVPFAFLKALNEGDSLWPYRPYSYVEDDFRYRQLPLSRVTQAQLSFAAWQFRPGDYVAPTKETRYAGYSTGRYRIPLATIPGHYWHILQNAAIFPTEWSLAAAQEATRSSLRSAWVSVRLHSWVQTPTGNECLRMVLSIQYPECLLGMPNSATGLLSLP